MERLPVRAVILNGRALQAMPVGLQDIHESTIVDRGLLVAGSMSVTIPAILFFLVVQRFLIRGGGMGAVN